MKKLQFDMVKLESKFYEEVHRLECQYAQLYAPILEQVSGDFSPVILYFQVICAKLQTWLVYI